MHFCTNTALNFVEHTDLYITSCIIQGKWASLASETSKCLCTSIEHKRGCTNFKTFSISDQYIRKTLKGKTLDLCQLKTFVQYMRRYMNQQRYIMVNKRITLMYRFESLIQQTAKNPNRQYVLSFEDVLPRNTTFSILDATPRNIAYCIENGHGCPLVCIPGVIGMEHFKFNDRFLGYVYRFVSCIFDEYTSCTLAGCDSESISNIQTAKRVRVCLVNLPIAYVQYIMVWNRMLLENKYDEFVYQHYVHTKKLRLEFQKEYDKFPNYELLLKDDDLLCYIEASVTNLGEMYRPYLKAYQVSPLKCNDVLQKFNTYCNERRIHSKNTVIDKLRKLKINNDLLSAYQNYYVLKTGDLCFPLKQLFKTVTYVLQPLPLDIVYIIIKFTYGVTLV